MNAYAGTTLDDLRRGRLHEILVAMRAALVRCNARDELTDEFRRLLDEIEDRIAARTAS